MLKKVLPFTSLQRPLYLFVYQECLKVIDLSSWFWRNKLKFSSKFCEVVNGTNCDECAVPERLLICKYFYSFWHLFKKLDTGESYVTIYFTSKHFHGHTHKLATSPLARTQCSLHVLWSNYDDIMTVSVWYNGEEMIWISI